MPEPLENLRRVRIEKLEKIRKLGIEPFPARWGKLESRIKNQELRTRELGEKIAAAGRLMGWREHGKIIFADLVDESGRTQLVFKEDRLLPIACRLMPLLDIGDFIGIEGKLFKTDAGELSIEVKDLTLLAKSLRPLPEKHEGLKDIETRYRQRYLDLLVNPEVKEVFRIRTKIIDELRNYLNKHGGFEVETPVLQPVYGGATARPFITHHNALDCDLYLRISDELYLKRLIVGGFKFVYEFGKDFRNEGISPQHNPEFTMLEFYWAWKDYNDLMQFTEEMLSHVIKKVTGKYTVEYHEDTLDFSPPWERKTFAEAVLTGSGLDITKVDTEVELRDEIKKRKINIDLKGVVGYGALLDAFYKQLVRPKIIGPLFLYDWPVEMVPLAKRKAVNPRTVESFQPIVKGMELLLSYSELNDPLDQRKRWEEEMNLARKGLEEYQVVDEDYLRALEYGMPPTAGWGMGIDRFTAIVTNQPSLKDVILFPTLRPEKGCGGDV